MFAALVLCGCAICLSSCNNDEDESCSCTKYEDGYRAQSREITPSSFGAKNCSDLAIKMEVYADYGVTYTCH